MSKLLKIKRNINNVKINIFFIMRKKRYSMSSVNLTKADFSWQLEVADVFCRVQIPKVDTVLPPTTLTCI